MIVPRLISIISKGIQHKQNVRKILQDSWKTLKRGLLPDRFPAFISKLIGLKLLLNPALLKVGLAPRQAQFLAATLSGLYCFEGYRKSLLSHPKQPGTLDLSTFVFVRATDIFVRRLAQVVGIPPLVSAFGDVAFFSVASFGVMFPWFYYPQRLSRPYQKWITMAADMDSSVVVALRELRNGNIKYGEEGPMDDLLVPLSKSVGYEGPILFSEVDKIPCEVIHDGVTKNCEIHGLYRFARGMRTAMSIYLPINIIVNSLSSRPLYEKISRTITGSLRSSAFLSTFIFFCWYGVCFERSRIGPYLFPQATGQQIDDTWGVALGSALSGLSCLVEQPKRRGELALFVAPKALEAALPLDFDEKFPQVERVLFSLSFALLVTDSRQARGFVGRVLRLLFN